MCVLVLLPAHEPAREDAARVGASRLKQNPLIAVGTSPSLGDNVNGPSIIRVPAWIPHPLGRYYAYFGHHKGQFIRLAYADAIAGPWKVHDAGGGAGQRDGVLPSSAGSSRRPDRSVLHPRGLS